MTVRKEWKPPFEAKTYNPVLMEEPVAKLLTPKNLDKHGVPEELFSLLRIASPYETRGEDDVRNLIRDIIKEYKVNARMGVDDEGNLIVRVGRKEDRKVCFSAHMDTVHDEATSISPIITTGYDNNDLNGYIFGTETKVVFTSFAVWENGKPGRVLATDDEKGNFARECGITSPKWWGYCKVKGRPKGAPENLQFWKAHSFPTKYAEVSAATPKGPFLVVHEDTWAQTPSVLGADDKVGCFIMLQLIREKIPGLYIFHTGEEAGCVGSRYIATKTPAVLDNIGVAIAFDRMYHNQVITLQKGSTRGASVECGKALASALEPNIPPQMQFEPDARGILTDTAQYFDIVPECFNLSVGYFNQHSDKECFDNEWLQSHLIPALKKVEWNALPVVRDPKEKPATTYRSSYGYQEYDNYQYQPPYNSRHKTPSGFEGKSKVRDELFDEAPLFAITRTEFWEDIMGLTPPWDVTASTDKDSLPFWKPEWGLYPRTTNEQMRRIILAWFSREEPTRFQVTNMLITIFSKMQELEEFMYCGSPDPDEVLDWLEEQGDQFNE